MAKEALDLLRTTEPAEYLAPSSDLSRVARAASSHLYTSLLPFCPSKPPLDQLLSDESFDAEQIWSQIDLLSKPLLPFLRRNLSRLEKESKSQLSVTKAAPKANGKRKEDEEQEEDNSEQPELGDEDEENEEVEEEEGEENDEEVGEDKNDEEGEAKGVEDKFLKIKELEKFLEDGEAEEYGLPVQKKKIDLNDQNHDDDSDQDEEDDNEDEVDALDLKDLDGDSDEDELENARYEDFFERQSNRGTRRKASTRKVKFDDEPQVKEIEFEETDDENENENEKEYNNENDKKSMSTHEKELAKLRSTIEEMERANLEPKSWTMIGEVTAAKRPVNSALEVDLDFEHNIRPAPVVTDEVTASLEELIKKRIIDGQFDDVQRAPILPTKAPRELKELDENKSKKGLAEIYEEEYAQKTGLAAAPISASDELKKEAEMLFKKICVKLDALSHFHFAPKPVIEDMSIQANVPALAMEEIAPIAVSDAAMLAPEEIFEGKGDIKEDRELTRADRKKRRANKKRRFKAELVKRAEKKPRPTTDSNGQ